LLSFIVTSLAHWFIFCCILCICFRFRSLSLYILVYLETPDDDCGYSKVLEQSSLVIFNVVSCSLSHNDGSWFVWMLRGLVYMCVLSVL